MAVSMGRLGPIYDAADLKETIEKLRASPDVLGEFFGEDPVDIPVCQGDIFKLESKIPFIDADGDAAATDNPSGLWQVLGNTCDLDRSIEEVPHSQLAPVELYDPPGNTAVDQKLIQYKAYRCFYLPPTPKTAPKHMLTDLTRPVTVDKQALLDKAERVARLNDKTWMLFHCVLVRFLARDDGRHD